MSQFRINKIIIHYGEIGLKGKNQPVFRKQLKRNIQQKLKTAALDWPVTETRGSLSIDVPESAVEQIEQARQILREVAGIVWFAPAVKTLFTDGNFSDGNTKLKKMAETVTQIANGRDAEGKTFCVRVKRSDKNFPFNSLQLERRFGAAIIENTNWKKVKLDNPDVTFSIIVQPGAALFYDQRFPGMGGLPVGTVGKALTLLSGGIDSPVAAFLAAKRGCRVDFIHFTATTMQQKEAAAYKITQLARDLSHFTLRSKLYLVPYIHFDMALFGKQVSYELILFRRFMARTAARLAGRIDAEVLLSGDNLAQVASQTMSNLVSTSRAIGMPILRPLLTYDKQEIIDLAKKIGTYQLSVEPYKDCCAIISRHPKTRSRHENLTRLEEEIFAGKYDDLIEKTLQDTVCLEFRDGEMQNSGVN
ncbi:MAG TPA: tRNA 4-thiouridine(8) synthase ThiI [Bacteroidetes bacterium]|nr:tRNA 4-thiouridine(8) synthase ThiI [Bacteroidota bacterium]